MKFSGILVKVVPAVCTAGLVLSIGVMCQKSKCAQTEPAKPTVAATVPAPQAVADSAVAAVKAQESTTAVKAVADTVVKAVAKAGYYTCPMHPKIHQAKPGKCPICKMDLVFKKVAKVATQVKK
jgi:membrane fusion protein, copper/silver efflux system